MAAVAAILTERSATITEAQRHHDPNTRTSFKRAVFHDGGSMNTLDRIFADYLPIVDGRKQEQGRCLVELFESPGAELQVLARYVPILTAATFRRATRAP